MHSLISIAIDVAPVNNASSVNSGQTELLLDSYAAGQIHNHTPDWIWHRLVTIHQLSHNISEIAIGSLQETEPDYYKQMRWLVDRPWKYGKDYRRLDPAQQWPSHIKNKGEWIRGNKDL